LNRNGYSKQNNSFGAAEASVASSLNRGIPYLNKNNSFGACSSNNTSFGGSEPDQVGLQVAPPVSARHRPHDGIVSGAGSEGGAATATGGWAGGALASGEAYGRDAARYRPGTTADSQYRAGAAAESQYRVGAAAESQYWAGATAESQYRAGATAEGYRAGAGLTFSAKAYDCSAPGAPGGQSGSVEKESSSAPSSSREDARRARWSLPTPLQSGGPPRGADTRAAPPSSTIPQGGGLIPQGGVGVDRLLGGSLAPPLERRPGRGAGSSTSTGGDAPAPALGGRRAGMASRPRSGLSAPGA